MSDETLKLLGEIRDLMKNSIESEQQFLMSQLAFQQDMKERSDRAQALQQQLVDDARQFRKIYYLIVALILAGLGCAVIFLGGHA